MKEKITQLPHWVITDLQPAFYDTDSSTSIEQTGRVYAKVSELVDTYNEFVNVINKHIEEFENGTNQSIEVFEIGIRQEFQDFIDIINLKVQDMELDLQDAVDYMKTNMSETVSSLLNEMKENGEMDASLLNAFNNIDERVVNLEDNTTIHANNINTMKSLELKDGDVVKTLGYYSANDGGGALYLIREKTENDVEDNGLIHFVSNNLVAELVINSKEINPNVFGAKHDGESDDSEPIQKCLNLLHEQRYTVLDLKGYTYNISNPLYLDEMHNVILKNGSIVANNNFNINSDITKNYLIYSTDVGSSYEGTGYKLSDVNFQDLLLDCDLIDGLGCINFKTYLRINFDNINFKRYKTYGFKDSEDNNVDGHEIKMTNCFFNAIHSGQSNESGVAIELSNHDSIFSNIIIRGGKTGISLIGEGNAKYNQFSNIHIYGCKEYAIKIDKQSNLVFNQIYFDGCGLYILNPWHISFINSLWLGSNFNPITLDGTSFPRSISGVKFISCNVNLSNEENVNLITLPRGNFTRNQTKYNQNIFDITGSGFNFNIDTTINNTQDYNLKSGETLKCVNGSVYNIEASYSNYNELKLNNEIEHYNSDASCKLITTNNYYTYNIINNTILVTNYNSNGYSWLGFLINLEQNKNYRVFDNFSRGNSGFKIVGLNSLDVGETGIVLKSESNSEFVEFNSGVYQYYMLLKYGKSTRDIVINKKL